ncbi:diguanylate cyclase [Pseudanabaena sp. FACHB-1998]|uniref:diguanylate cyclase domain-containing protein n=1 Tax=Pseudanabaena sp. FACHB-1998 TaxID=2692858 RepID=UPI00168026AF|nr:diguanylate cyclase [Pseudanabaena sp. FACHB-1998]MBD2175669.1 diguanylate cyclase [Pseudanabaena sp. FACHB-1998]
MAVSRPLSRALLCNIPLRWTMFIPFALQFFVWICLVSSGSENYRNHFLFFGGFSLLLLIMFAISVNRFIIEPILHLKHSCEDRWKLAMQASNDGIWDFDFITQQKFISERCAEIHGYDFWEIATIEQWLALIHPDDKQEVIKAFQKHIKREVPQYIADYRFLCKDGRYKWLLDRGQAIWNDHGKPVRIIGSLTDINDRKLAEQALRQSEARLKAFLDNAPTPITIKDLEGNYISVNNEFTYLVQLPETAILNQKDYDIFPKHNVQNVRKQELQAIFEEIAVSFEESVPLPDGLHTFFITKFPLLNENNKPYAVGGIYLDISDRIRAELELAYSRELREVIYNDSADAIFLVDPLSLLVFDCNQRAVAMFEADSKDELLGIEGQTLQKYRFTEIELNSINEQIQEYGFWHREMEYITKKGNHFWGNLAVKQINVAGKEINLVRVTDISDRKRAEALIQENEARFQKIANTSPESIYIMVRYPDGTYLFEYASAATEELLGVNIAYLLNRPNPHYELFHPDDIAGYEEAITKSLNSMQTFNYEWRIITPQKKIKWIKTQACPELRSNGDIAWYGFAIDISDRKKAEITLGEIEANLRRANQELERLVNIDGLTQIANRRCFNDRIITEWQRLYREQQPLALLLFDVDYFKHYNDHYGHQAGDECLVKIAQAVQNLIQRPADLVARYGGEEFMVILPNTDISGAIAVAQRIHQGIKGLKISHLYSEVNDMVTVSQGVASAIPDLERSPHTLIKNVDLALYQAKKQGRNQSVVFKQ